MKTTYLVAKLNIEQVTPTISMQKLYKSGVATSHLCTHLHIHIAQLAYNTNKVCSFKLYFIRVSVLLTLVLYNVCNFVQDNWQVFSSQLDCFQNTVQCSKYK